MASEWPLVPLSELTSTPATYGVVQPGTYVQDGLPMLRVNNFDGHSLNLTDVMKIAPEIESKYERTRIRSGDVLITIVGSVGQVAVVPRELNGWNIARAVAMIRPKEPELSRWIAFVLHSPQAQHQLGVAANTTVQTTINLKDLRALQIPLPDKDVRREICETLSALDDRIDNLRQTNVTLESIATSLFKSWFVDFDGHAPQDMQESEVGLIPKGWRVVPFGELLSDSIGGDWGSDVQDGKNTERVAIIRGTDIPDLKSQIGSRVPVRYTTAKKLASRRLAQGDLVVEVSGGSKDQPTGRSLYLTCGLLGQFDCPVVPASFCRKFTPINAKVGLLLAQHMSYIYGIGKTWEYQNQSTGIANFQTAHFLKSELVIVPTEEVLNAFFELVSPMAQRMQFAQAASLVFLRDTLLPRLISGQLRVNRTQMQSS